MPLHAEILAQPRSELQDAAQCSSDRPKAPMQHKAIIRKYRDVAYIRRDIISKLMHYGELSQNRLMSYCGLNTVKHRPIIEQLVELGLINRSEKYQGGKRVLNYVATEKGIHFCQMILGPYEELFPRELSSLGARTIA